MLHSDSGFYDSLKSGSIANHNRATGPLNNLRRTSILAYAVRLTRTETGMCLPILKWNRATSLQSGPASVGGTSISNLN